MWTPPYTASGVVDSISASGPESPGRPQPLMRLAGVEVWASSELPDLDLLDQPDRSSPKYYFPRPDDHELSCQHT